MAEEPKFRRGPSGEIHDVGPRLRWIEGRGPYSPDKTELAQERAARERAEDERDECFKDNEGLLELAAKMELDRAEAAEQRAERAEAARCCNITRTGKHQPDCPRILYQDVSERFEQLAAAVRAHRKSDWPENTYDHALYATLDKLQRE